MDNLNDRALGAGFGVIVYLLAMLTLMTFIGIGYKTLTVKAATEQDRNALKMGRNTGAGNEEFEDREVTVYNTGGVGSPIEAAANGDAVTGASVFTEVQHLPPSVKYVYKNGTKILSNAPGNEDTPIIDSLPNAAYYIVSGKSDELLEILKSSGINQEKVYIREYRFQTTDIDKNGNTIDIGGRVVGVDYTD